MFQQTVDNTGSTLETTHEVLVYNDGSMITQGWADAYDLVFTRFDASGVPLWRRSIFIGDQAGGSPPTTATPDGGFVIATSRTTQFPDSDLIDLVKFSVTGATEWKRSFLLGNDYPQLNAGCSITCSASGELFLVVRAPQRSSISKLDPQGVELWTRLVWDGDFGDALDLVIKAEPMPDGGCAFLGVGVNDFAGPSFAVGRVDAFGGVQWTKAFTYGSSNALFYSLDLASDPQDQIVVTGALIVLGSGGYVFTARVDTTGQLVRSDLYQNDPLGAWYQSVTTEPLANHGLFFSGGDHNNGNALAFKVDQVGIPTGGMACSTVNIGPVEHVIRHWSCKSSVDSIYWIGNLVLRDTIFGTEEGLPTLWKSGTDLTGFCATDPFTVDHYEVPAALITSEDVGNDSVVSYPSFSLPVMNTVMTTPGVASYCGLVGLSETSLPEGFRIGPNPTDDRITVEWTDRGSITGLRLVDVYGRSVAERTVTGPRAELELGNLAPGSYLLFVTDGRGTKRCTTVIKR